MPALVIPGLTNCRLSKEVPAPLGLSAGMVTMLACCTWALRVLGVFAANCQSATGGPFLAPVHLKGFPLQLSKAHPVLGASFSSAAGLSAIDLPGSTNSPGHCMWPGSHSTLPFSGVCKFVVIFCPKKEV